MIMKSDVLPFSNSTKTGDPGQLTGDISGAQVTIDLVKNGMGSAQAVDPVTLYGQVKIWIDLGLLDYTSRDLAIWTTDLGLEIRVRLVVDLVIP